MTLLNYDAYEKAVYDWLMVKHQADPSFCFSTRLRASKGSEHKHFIGTKKSAYFGTTFWWVPVSFPGSSSDLINLIFRFNNGAYQCYMQFGQTRAPHDEQNQEALLFIKNLKEVFRKGGVNFWENDPGNKMEYFNTVIADGHIEISDFLKEIDTKLEGIINLVDRYLNDFKATSNIEANRISEDLFINKFQRSLNSRLNNIILIQNDLDEEEVLLKNDITTNDLYSGPLNQILFGPPGTGKTYSTINKALSIIENKKEEELELESRTALLDRFEFYRTKNQIVWTTFHQSLSYEDFLEGIKPEIEEDKDGVRSVVYAIKDGVFKTICNKARLLLVEEDDGKTFHFDDAWNELLGRIQNYQEIQEDFILDILTPNKGLKVTEITNNGNLKLSPKSISGLDYTVSYSRMKELHQAVPSLKNVKNINKEFRAVIGGMNSTAYWAVLNFINTWLFNANESKQLVEKKAKAKPHVLIIDEINRGNVSAIFGELITLLEEGKRKAVDKVVDDKFVEALEVTLPYSKEKFSVPSNLYVIGTMNTADRSVEALDTALRRRFSFQEMMPRYDLLSPDSYRYHQLMRFAEKYYDVEWIDWAKEYSEIATEFYFSIGLTVHINSGEERLLYELIESDGFTVDNLKTHLGDFRFESMFDLGYLLETINKRIAILYDREHQIGHSYFLKIKDRMKPIPELRLCFKNEIIPLLQEYFFGDYEKIGLVLGEGFVSKTQAKGNVFAKFSGSNPSDFVKPEYLINIETLTSDESFGIGLRKLLGTEVDAELLNQPA